MRQHSLMLGLMIAILLTAGTAIVVVSFQLKDNTLSAEAIASPDVEPPLQQQSEATQSSNTAQNNQQTSNSGSVSNTSNGGTSSSPAVSGGGGNSSTESNSATSPSQSPVEIQTIVSASKPANIDGVVSQDEYAVKHLIEENGLEIFWSIPAVQGGAKPAIFIALRSPATGCVGISLDPSGPRLKGGDILLGYVRIDPEKESSELVMQDHYANQETSHSQDTELNRNLEATNGEDGAGHYGRSDILDARGSIDDDGRTTIEFSRYLNTEDNAWDKPIKTEPNSSMRIQVSYSETPELNCFQTGEGHSVQKRINFMTGEIQDELQA